MTCRQHFYANISCKCRNYRSLPFSQIVAPLLPPQSQPPPFASTQSLLASYCSPSSSLHTRSSMQPSQPPTHSLGMNRSEKLSCIIKCAKVLLNKTALDVEEFFLFFGGVQNAVQISKLLLGQFRGVMCLTCASKAESHKCSPFHLRKQSSCLTLSPPWL